MKKKLLVAVVFVVVASQAQARNASTDRLCEAISGAAEAAAENRDLGVPMNKMIDAVDQVNLDKQLAAATKRMVRVIYNTPSVTPAIAKATYRDGCLKGMK